MSLGSSGESRVGVARGLELAHYLHSCVMIAPMVVADDSGDGDNGCGGDDVDGGDDSDGADDVADGVDSDGSDA